MQDSDSAFPSLPNSDAESSASPPVPQLLVKAAASFNYAAWQNAVPLLQEVTIDNASGPELSSLTVELKASPSFTHEKRWLIDRVRAGEKLKLNDIDLDIDPAYLDSLDEAERGVLSIQLNYKGNTLHTVNHGLRVLARDEWGGMPTMGELLPAFVTPNDPALAAILKSAAEILGKHGHATALDGYQSGDPNRAYLLVAAVWSAVAARSLVYANPPGSFEQVGQKTRRVGTVLSDGLATCLDSTLLFASGLEAVGLNPVLVVTEGHCFAGVWLIKKSFNRLVERDCTELRKAIAAKELIVFETTLVTHNPPPPFPDAVTTATAALAEEKENEFVAVVDVYRARMSQIRPLASHGTRKEVDLEKSKSGPPPLPDLPRFDVTSVVEPEERPQTPAGRIERWQRKLLDLSLRNRLLNFRSNKQSIPVLCPDVSQLEDLLADGIRMRLISLEGSNPIAERDVRLHQKRTQKDLELEFAKRALERNEVACQLTDSELNARLTALFRKVRNDLAEGGSNTLYLAVGFLRWKQKPTDDNSYRAPLLLVPVSLMRRSASSPFYLATHEDEVRFNATLLQLLKKDFDCDLTSFETDLPTDDSGVDVPCVLERMRRAVRDIPGFEVVEEAAIAPFSFAKYLMWKDLVDRVGQLEHNRVVRHLIHDPDKAFMAGGSSRMPSPYEVDTRYTPNEIFHPLPADSSQLAAVMAASEGHDLVIVGPPGTGKSQTIANTIAQCLAVKKTVLFVAEKTAALDVVHRRLREHGLGDCCVELHSNKAQRRQFLDQLEASWKNRGKAEESDWVTINTRLQVRRDQLNAYANALHAREANGWTAYRAMGECVRGRDVVTPRLNWPAMVQHDEKEYASLQLAVAELASTFAAVPADATLPRVLKTDWSMAWESEFLEACRRLKMATETLAQSLDSLSKLLDVTTLADVSTTQLLALDRMAGQLAQPNFPSEAILLNDQLDKLALVLNDRVELLKRREKTKLALEATVANFREALAALPNNSESNGSNRPLYQLANELVRPNQPPAELVFHGDFDLLEKTLVDRPNLLRSQKEAFAALEARSFTPTLIDRIPVENLVQQWSQAKTAIWPLSIWKTASTKKRLKAYMKPGGVAEPEIDIPLLCEYRDLNIRLGNNLASLGLPPHLQAVVEKDPAGLDSRIQSAQRLRKAITSAGHDPNEVGQAVGNTLTPLIDTARPLFPPGREYEAIRKKLKESLAELNLPADLLPIVDKDASTLNSQIQVAQAIRAEIAAIGFEGEQYSHTLSTILAIPEGSRDEVALQFCRSTRDFHEAWTQYSQLAAITPVPEESFALLADSTAQAERVLLHRTALKQWTAWMAVRERAERLGISTFVEALQAGDLEPAEAASQFRLAYARWWLPAIVDLKEPLRTFQKFLHEDAIDEFCRLDDLARQAAAPRVRQAVLHDLPPSDQVPRKSELGLLRHQMGLKRPSKSIREVITGMPESFGKLAPCLLMSPLSIAQYLPTDQASFDVVIFDEASQIPTWDAIGAIARGRQTIIVGDPKQLPPTNFFGRTDNDGDNTDLEDHEKDLESILDEAVASGLPTRQLNWHYRSRHESLIAFSNWNYYGNDLVTFPAAESEDRGVVFKHIADATYDRGKSRTNRQEAEAIVTDAVERMKRCLGKPVDQRLTYGVVTFNSQQQDLIQDFFDEALRQHPELEWFFSDDRIEPTAVKNLENVQGDERDVMMFSITFGFDAAGKFPTTFGAINREGGERRLNVAVTRARQELVIYASFLPEQLRAERSSARGVHDLKAFLEYAEKGPAAMIAQIERTDGRHESPLEEAVATALEERNWRIDPQVGVSGFRIDLGIIHPDKPGAYLAGIECDGATYHRAAMARDRDKTRQQVLENLGWTILRIWSTDWWYDPKSAIEQIDRSLNELLESSRAQHAVEEPEVPTNELRSDIGTGHEDIPVEPYSDSEPAKLGSFEDTEITEVNINELDTRPQLIAKQTPQKDRPVYSRIDLGDATANQDRFFDDDYSDTLAGMALAVLEKQWPIREDVLAREVARAHGFGRTGNRIKQRVLGLLPEVTSTKDAAGRFLWSGFVAQDSLPFRYPTGDGERRSLDEIALPELIGLVREHPALAASEDPALALAREIGLARLARSARERLEDAIERGLREFNY